MKYFFYLLLFLIFSLNTSCHKEPTAGFTTDKDLYYAGETVHLRDISGNAHSYKWTMPDGSIYNTKDLDYATNIDDIGGAEIFSLEVFSRNGKRSAITSKSIMLSQPIFSSDYFSDSNVVNHLIFKPALKIKRTYTTDGNWVIYAADNIDPVMRLFIYLPTTSAPMASGIYSLQTYQSSLSSGKACVQIARKGGGDPPITDWSTSYSGSLSITIMGDGKVHAVFSSIDDTSFLKKMSGDIICH
jgi:PKD repeat protein